VALGNIQIDSAKGLSWNKGVKVSKKQVMDLKPLIGHELDPIVSVIDLGHVAENGEQSRASGQEQRRRVRVGSSQKSYFDNLCKQEVKDMKEAPLQAFAEKQGWFGYQFKPEKSTFRNMIDLISFSQPIISNNVVSINYQGRVKKSKEQMRMFVHKNQADSFGGLLLAPGPSLVHAGMLVGLCFIQWPEVDSAAL